MDIIACYAGSRRWMTSKRRNLYGVEHHNVTPYGMTAITDNILEQVMDEFDQMVDLADGGAPSMTSTRPA